MSIEATLDVFDFRRSVKVFASQHGFERRVCQALELVASELGTNILKHGVRGVVCVQLLAPDARGIALRIDASDEGPPIENWDAALTDGWSSSGPLDPATMLGRRGIGAGLGSIRRLTDEFSYARRDGRNHFTAVRYRKP